MFRKIILTTLFSVILVENLNSMDRRSDMPSVTAAGGTLESAGLNIVFKDFIGYGVERTIRVEPTDAISTFRKKINDAFFYDHLSPPNISKICVFIREGRIISLPTDCAEAAKYYDDEISINYIKDFLHYGKSGGPIYIFFEGKLTRYSVSDAARALDVFGYEDRGNRVKLRIISALEKTKKEIYMDPEDTLANIKRKLLRAFKKEHTRFEVMLYRHAKEVKSCADLRDCDFDNDREDGENTALFLSK